MSLHLHPPFRAEHLGSLKRPRTLLNKRDDFDKNACTAEELRKVEDEAIKAIVQIASERDDLGPELRPWLAEFVAGLD